MNESSSYNYIIVKDNSTYIEMKRSVLFNNIWYAMEGKILYKLEYEYSFYLGDYFKMSFKIMTFPKLGLLILNDDRNFQWERYLPELQDIIFYNKHHNDGLLHVLTKIKNYNTFYKTCNKYKISIS